ncbi:nitroreductase family deazaflavin-dependent oxidoreductase [Labedaea rhizosphaerae]|uniref:Deazaflavin-dependent oxidoreductase (Nitroreductase family) n=1 Tax=Labedaea rhizosphaerae TaxID=598644 RepID=A0A4R6SDT1_LABRH|nr:nitroreductase family deazaflavin-dependent oxidoreductase [Labedaea rhizosphaerae]TDP98042.1 deazaflavin-dependent oxidoreductase (nitroreductase family) [Labedaea rhizosphaerae]
MGEQVFPDAVRSKKSALFKAVEGVGGSKLGSRLGRLFVPLDRRLLQRSNGRRGLLGSIAPPTLLLTTTGRKSGQPRTTPLYYHQDGDRIYLMGSNFGRQHHPAWTDNLLADPLATVAIGGKDIPVRAELLRDEESEWVFGELVKITSAYRAYRGRTARQFRVFKLVGADA